MAKGSKKGAGGHSNLTGGMSTTNPVFPDKSTGMKGPSVDKGAKRTGTAATPPSMGPRRVG